MSQGIASILSTASDTANLRLQAGVGEEDVDSEVIQQFEALFLQQMLKSMRTASLGDGLFQSDQSEFYRDMYDQQIATDLAKKELLGIAQLINRQLGNNILSQEETVENESGIKINQDAIEKVAVTQKPEVKVEDPANSIHLDAFIDKLTDSVTSHAENKISVDNQVVEKLRPLAFKPDSLNEFVNVAYKYAQEPAKKLGVDPNVLVAIAALETGWGNHVPQDASGSSNNYFGIKADTRWEGQNVSSKTLEFEQGTFKELKQSFRVYDTLKDSFNDYAEFLTNNDRYSYALEFAGDTKRFLQEIQNAGYATDPSYASKIMDVLTNSAFSKK